MREVSKSDSIEPEYVVSVSYTHLYQLAGENANPKNLITGTRYLNVEGMLPFENLVADYVNNTGNHVLYRVTPMFSGSNLAVSYTHLDVYKRQPLSSTDFASMRTPFATRLLPENIGVTL